MTPTSGPDRGGTPTSEPDPGRTPTAGDHPLLDSGDDPQARERYRERMGELRRLVPHFRGRRVLGMGVDTGLTAAALTALGARKVVWAEPSAEVAATERERWESAGMGEELLILHQPDLRRLPFSNDAFPFVLALGVFQEIPRPRLAWLREFWRLVRPGGHLFVAGTPNRYLPAAEARRGVGHRELLSPMRGAEVRYDVTRPRHHLLKLLGLPANLLDPEPRWLIHKPARAVPADRPQVRLPDTRR